MKQIQVIDLKYLKFQFLQNTFCQALELNIDTRWSCNCLY